MDPKIFLENSLKQLTEKNASDLHIKSGVVPRLRVSGTIQKMETDAIGPKFVSSLADSLMNDGQKELFKKNRSVDLAFASETYGRFRANIFWQRGTTSIVIRVIKNLIPSFSELYLPAVFEKISLQERGLILISGATSTGKSTTVASMVNYINQERDGHILTIEDPIEYMHEDKRCIINQREIGQDAVSFSDALKYVVRQDPDVIVVGEMRDPESFKSAIVASETGHLVISTIHAKNVQQVFDRILGFFPSDQREQVLVQLSFNLKAVAAQRLLRKKDKKGLVPVCEVLMNNGTIAQLIRDNKMEKLPQAIANCSEEGMQTFHQALCKLYNEGFVSKEEALMASDNPQALEMNMKGIYLDEGSGGILDR
ncbi:MAG: PilT/PilU family type 4a pilus ATPase [Candidatus Omnitrophica bacterium]|nr:PilT/PilU family type 4a pilus ATPase [Candidatus Omnitrophota bacterium]